MPAATWHVVDLSAGHTHFVSPLYLSQAQLSALMASTRSKRSAASAGVLQEISTPAKVARVGGAEPAVIEKAKKIGESSHAMR